MAILSDAQVQDLKNQWNNLSYDQQQAKLKANSWLQWALTNLGLTAKSNPNDSIINSSQVAKNTGNYTQQGTNFTIWGQTVWAREWSKPNDNWTVVWWYTTPQGNNGSILQDASPVDAFSSSSTWPKSILDKPTNPVSNFNVLGINPYGQQTTQKWNNTTKQTSVSTPKNTNTRTTVTPQQQQWDYQDNSQARMDQIADNLDKYTITNPDLFKDYDSFYNFFIAGKGRSEDQIRFLDQYYADYKKNEKYKNLTPEQIGSGIANGSIPEDYISTVAATDPNKAEAIRAALNDSQDTIRNESYLSSLAEENWFEKWNRDIMGYKDENKDWIDDWLYVAPTAEEQRDVDRINEIDARVMEIDNAIKNTYEDLRDRYPWAAQSTLMAMANDRNKNLQRERDDLMVEKTKLQWTVKYQQDERSYQMSARKDTISELQKNYWMYYDYSPEWIKERTQAEYEATHITLDQADSWTETDKKMALQWVLDWYYEKYWDIIQRSEQQVINDVIATAKKEWISLSDALEKNFLKPLREKPQFASISAGSTASWVQWTKIGKDADWNDVYWFVNTDTMTVSPYWNVGWTSYTPEQINNSKSARVKAMSEMAMWNDNIEWMANSIASWMDWLGWGDYECGQYTNDYIEAVTWNRWWYGNSIASKIAQTDNQDWNNVQVWDAIVFDWTKNTPKWVMNREDKQKLLECGHVWFVTGKDENGNITISHTNWWVVTETTIAPWSDFYNAFAGSQHIKWSKAAVNWYNEQLTNEYSAYFSKPESIDELARKTWLSVDEFREQANAYSRSQTAEQYTDVLNTIDSLIEKIDNWTITPFREREQLLNEWWFEWAVRKDSAASDWYADNDRLVSTLWLDALINLKGRWATFWALSDSERQAINSYANKLWNAMSDTKYRQELVRIKNKLLSSEYWKYFKQDSQEWEYDPRAWI